MSLCCCNRTLRRSLHVYHVDHHVEFISAVDNGTPISSLICDYICDDADDQINISHWARQAAINGNIDKAYSEIKSLIRLNSLSRGIRVQI